MRCLVPNQVVVGEHPFSYRERMTEPLVGQLCLACVRFVLFLLVLFGWQLWQHTRHELVFGTVIHERHVPPFDVIYEYR